MNSSSLSIKPDVTLSLTLPTTSPKIEVQELEVQERNINLIQQLITCVKHVGTGNLRHADSCLRQISQIASIHGDSFQRVAAQFAYALSIRLVKRWSGLYKVIEPNKWPKTELGILNKPSFPLLGLAYTVIVQTLVQSLTYDNMIHLVDLGSGDPKLWVSFMRSLASMSRGGSLHLKITCIHRNKVVLDILGKKLVKEAQSLLHLPFEYNPLNVGLGELNIMEMIEVRSGEALAFVSILSLHVLLAEDDRVEAHFGFGSHDKIDNVKDCKEMGKFLATIRSNMSPKLILLVEQEAEHNLNRLVDRFIGSLHYYSAVFDSLDFCFGNSSSSSKERLTLEAIFGKEIENIVACEGLERERRRMKNMKSGWLGFVELGLGLCVCGPTLWKMPIKWWRLLIEKVLKLLMIKQA